MQSLATHWRRRSPAQVSEAQQRASEWQAAFDARQELRKADDDQASRLPYSSMVQKGVPEESPLGVDQSIRSRRIRSTVSN